MKYSPSAISPRIKEKKIEISATTLLRCTRRHRRAVKHRTTDLRVGLVFRDSIVKKYYRKYCLVRTRTPQAEGESLGRSRARGITRKLRKTAMLQPLFIKVALMIYFLEIPSKKDTRFNCVKIRRQSWREKDEKPTIDLPLFLSIF